MIGESKQDVLAKVEKIKNILYVEPVPESDINVDNPNRDSIHLLDKERGILVWLNHQPFPLRIEFKDDVVSKKWGDENPCVASEEAMRTACKEIKRLEQLVHIGSSRREAYETILSFETRLSKGLGNFIVGYQEFVTGQNKSESEFRELLLANDAWRFEGLKNMSKFKDPYNSRVTLYFGDGKLIKIKYWATRYEI